MSNSQKIRRSAATGRVKTAPIGRSKATKFLLVEGMKLSTKSSNTLNGLKARGLKGDALRTAISGSLKKF